MTTRVSLYLRPGDDETRLFKYLDSAGVVVPLTGFTASWVGTVGATTVTITGSVDGVNGKVTVTVPKASTTSLGTAGSNGHYNLTVTSAGGLVTSIAHGPLVMQSH